MKIPGVTTASVEELAAAVARAIEYNRETAAELRLAGFARRALRREVMADRLESGLVVLVETP